MGTGTVVEDLCGLVVLREVGTVGGLVGGLSMAGFLVGGGGFLV